MPRVYGWSQPLLSLAFAAFLRRPDEYYVSSGDLRSITSVNCLKQKQIDPSIKCGEGGDGHRMPQMVGMRGWRMGNYPSFNDSACLQEPNPTATFDAGHNTAEDVQPFCDPDAMLTPAERKVIEQHLFDFWVNTRVNCPQPGTTFLFERPFRLGVALVRTLPTSEQDEESLALFGQYVLGEWGLEGWGTATREIGMTTQCPSTALIVLVEEPYHSVYVASPNCDFICQSRGGDYIATSVHMGWDVNLSTGILKGIEEFGRVLPKNPASVISEQEEARSMADVILGHFTEESLRSLVRKEHAWNTLQYILLAIVITIGVVSLAILCRHACMYVCLRCCWDLWKPLDPTYIDNTRLTQPKSGTVF